MIRVAAITSRDRHGGRTEDSGSLCPRLSGDTGAARLSEVRSTDASCIKSARFSAARRKETRLENRLAFGIPLRFLPGSGKFWWLSTRVLTGCTGKITPAGSDLPVPSVICSEFAAKLAYIM